jgi:uncharacterized phage protein (TIGR02220 family)
MIGFNYTENGLIVWRQVINLDGYIKLYRKLLDNPIVCKDSDYLAVWIYILLNATHKEVPALFSGKKIILKPGQLITGRKSISEKLNISESKVTRIINSFIFERQIEQQTCNKNRLITILNWNDYQGSERQTEQQVNSTFGKKDALLYESTPKNEQQLNSWNTDKSTVTGILKTESEQQLNNKRTTTEQQLNTNKNVNNNVKNIYKDIVEYLNQKTGQKFKHTTKSTQRHINARLSEGFTLDDFKTVIDKKVAEWGHEPKAGEKDMRPYLRPETLFGPKFEGYLNQQVTTKSTSNNKFNNFPQRQYTSTQISELERKLINKGL